MYHVCEDRPNIEEMVGSSQGKRGQIGSTGEHFLW